MARAGLKASSSDSWESQALIHRPGQVWQVHLADAGRVWCSVSRPSGAARVARAGLKVYSSGSWEAAARALAALTMASSYSCAYLLLLLLLGPSCSQALSRKQLDHSGCRPLLYRCAIGCCTAAPKHSSCRVTLHTQEQEVVLEY